MAAGRFQAENQHMPGRSKTPGDQRGVPGHKLPLFACN